MLVHVYATLRPIVGDRQVDVPVSADSTVIELVRDMAKRWPDLEEHLLDEAGGLSRRVNVFVGGRNARWLDGERTRIDPGTRIDIFPPVAGG